MLVLKISQKIIWRYTIMVTREKVVRVNCPGSTHTCIIMQYLKDDRLVEAVLADNLSVKEGDFVWILHDIGLNYRGYSSVAVLLA